MIKFIMKEYIKTGLKILGYLIFKYLIQQEKLMI